MNARGFTLVESILALALLGITAMSLIPALMLHADTNTRNEIRTEAVGLVQERMEQLRLGDPDAMPTGGAPDSTAIVLGGRNYEVKTFYCRDSDFCPPASPGSRHLTVEVFLEGKRIYDVETVYTQLR